MSAQVGQDSARRQDTALRDIDDLVGPGVLAKGAAGGRSTSYSLVVPDVEGSNH